MVDFMGSNKTIRWVIGIDPGKNTGFAVYDIERGELRELTTVDFWTVYHKVLNTYSSTTAAIYIEVPKTKHVFQKKATGDSQMQRQAVNIGSVIREAELLAEGLERVGYTVTRKHPQGKVSAERFESYTGWTGRSNEHTRDAAMLCYGRNK